MILSEVRHTHAGSTYSTSAMLTLTLISSPLLYAAMLLKATTLGGRMSSTSCSALSKAGPVLRRFVSEENRSGVCVGAYQLLYLYIPTEQKGACVCKSQRMHRHIASVLLAIKRAHGSECLSLTQ